ncbi:DUF6240 domain-containing protein [Natranaerovirga hydrolytica]|nr:DUF6240 domain-containing protein [Natranaerovirga hydrolytica]
MKVLGQSKNQQMHLNIFNQALLGKKGDKVEGKIIGFDNNTALININNTIVGFNNTEVLNKNKGDKVNFQITNINNKKVELQYISEGNNNLNNNHCTNIKTTVNLFNIIEALEQEKKQTENKDVEKTIDHVLSRLTTEDVDKIVEEGYNPEKLEIDQFNTIISRVKDDTKREPDSNIESLVEEYSDLTNNTEQLKSVINKLKESNLPINAHTVSKVLKAMNRFESVVNLKDQSIAHLLKNELDINLHNIYKASFISGQGNNRTQSIDFADLENQIQDILQESNIEYDNENKEKSHWLIKNEIPLTKENIQKMDQLKNLDTLDIEEKLDIITKAVKEGLNIEEKIIEVDEDNESIPFNAKDILHYIDHIKEEHIQYTIKNELPLNIKQISEAPEQDKSIELNHNEQHQYITAKRQLEEIRLKLTFDSVHKFIDKDIHIETETLENVVESLKEAEQKYYSAILDENNIEKTKENLQRLEDTHKKIEALKTMPMTMLGKSLTNQEESTLQSIYDNGLEEKTGYEKAGESYEALMTQPRKDMGDSITKTYHQIKPILEDMGLESTIQNERAVKILAYHEMPITHDNIDAVKALDVKVNNLLNIAHPSIVAQMIKEKKNPMEDPIDKVIKEFSAIQEKLGVSYKEKASYYIYEMDKSGTLTEEERESLIGFYRLFKSIEKSEGKVVGFLLNQEQEVNLKNLLTATRLIKSRSLDVTIDEEFGALEEIKTEGKKIDEQIQSALTQSEDVKTEYYTHLMNQLKTLATPNKLQALTKDEDITTRSLEGLVDDLMQVDETQVKNTIQENMSQEIYETIQQLKNLDAQTLSFIDELELPYTIENILTAQILMENNYQLKDSIKTIFDKGKKEEKEVLTKVMSNFISITDEEALESQIEALQEAVMQIQEQNELEAMSSDINKAFEYSEKLFQVQEHLSKKQFFQLPVILDGQITQFNVHFLNKKQGANKEIRCSLPTHTFGNVEGKFVVNNQEILMDITLENNNYVEKLKEHIPAVEKAIENLGYEVKAMEIHSKGTTSIKVNHNVKFI